MGRIKLIAKSDLLGNSGALFAVFTVSALILLITGDFSLLTSYLFRLPFLKDFVSTDFAYRMMKITLSVTGMVISALTVPVLSFGVERWFVMRAEGKDVRLKDIFCFFRLSQFLRCQAAFWYSFFIRAGVFIFFQFPAICVTGVVTVAFRQGETAYDIAVALIISVAFLILTGLGFYFVYSARWLIYSCIIASDDTVSPYNAYKQSSAFSDEYAGRLCLFRLSFIPWWMLCVFVFPLFYVWGYYRQSIAVLAYERSVQKNDE